MKPIPLTAIKLLLLAFSLGQFSGMAGSTNQSASIPAPPTVRTNFVKEAQLSDVEVKQVLELARKCGMADPAEVSTQFYPPGGPRITVKSAERIDGRSTRFDTLFIQDGNDWEGITPDETIKQVGKFWAVASPKSTTHLRRYEFKGDTLQVSLGNNITAVEADKIIALFLSHTFIFTDGTVCEGDKLLKNFKPASLFKNGSSGEYEMYVNNPGSVYVQFIFPNQQIIITSISEVTF
jgi:hypothetical protein